MRIATSLNSPSKNTDIIEVMIQRGLIIGLVCVLAALGLASCSKEQLNGFAGGGPFIPKGDVQKNRPTQRDVYAEGGSTSTHSSNSFQVSNVSIGGGITSTLSTSSTFKVSGSIYDQH